MHARNIIGLKLFSIRLLLRAARAAGGSLYSQGGIVPGHDVIVIGASTGGVEALMQIVRDLPADLPAAMLVVLHIPPQGVSRLPQILSRAGALPATHPADHEPLRPGHIYVAPPDFHVLVEKGKVRVVRGPRENRARPAIDPLFRSAATAYGPRVVGVILTGALDDGTAGLWAIKQRGGIAVVQNPEDALVASMPANALEYVDVNYCLPLSAIPALLVRLAHEPAEGEEAYPVPKAMELESKLAASDPRTMENEERPGALSAFTCPECKGPLWELHDGKLIRFRCRQGHAFTADAMLNGQAEAVEDALWTALNILQEHQQMLYKLAKDARRRQLQGIAARFERQAQERETQMDALRQVLLNGKQGEPPALPITGEAEEQMKQA